MSLDEEQIGLLRSIKGLGVKDAEILKNVLLAYVSEKGYLDDFNGRKK